MQYFYDEIMKSHIVKTEMPHRQPTREIAYNFQHASYLYSPTIFIYSYWSSSISIQITTHRICRRCNSAKSYTRLVSLLLSSHTFV